MNSIMSRRVTYYHVTRAVDGDVYGTPSVGCAAPLVVDDATEALAEQLIASSAHHGEITSHAYSDALASALYAHSDDEADSGTVREYWGSEPNSWRVHLHRSTEVAS